jgi:chromosome segregation ATPase
MRAWAFIAIGLVVALVAVLGPPLIQLQNDSRAARARITELESVVANLKKELDAANQKRTELEGVVEEANSEIEKRQSDIVRLSTEVERLSAELEKALELAKAPNQQGESTSEPSNGWQPQ